jgi:quercetin dioxygenase-like cupin family protein
MEKMLPTVQPRAIVSQALLKKENGNVTLFAVDAGEGISEHTTPHDALVQVVEGRVALTIGGEVVERGPGEWALMPADIPHAVRALTPLRFTLTMIR